MWPRDGTQWMLEGSNKLGHGHFWKDLNTSSLPCTRCSALIGLIIVRVSLCAFGQWLRLAVFLHVNGPLSWDSGPAQRVSGAPRALLSQGPPSEVLVLLPPKLSIIKIIQSFRTGRQSDCFKDALAGGSRTKCCPLSWMSDVAADLPNAPSNANMRSLHVARLWLQWQSQFYHMGGLLKTSSAWQDGIFSEKHSTDRRIFCIALLQVQTECFFPSCRHHTTC